MRRTISLAATAAVIAIGIWGASATAFGTDTKPAPSAALSATRVQQAAPQVPATGTWNIDPAHTNVNFAIKHMGISTVRGRFDDVSGTLYADTMNPEKSTVQVTIKVASIDTDIKMRDDHLKSPDFFDAEKYPEITFRSTRVEKKRGGSFVAHGNLTMHGVTREIALPFKVAGPVKDQQAGVRVGAETQVRLNRQDFGIKYNQVLDNGALAVANDVDVTISLEVVPAKSEATK
jgi:polyisoprenoid-binding protein YceI